MKARCFGNVGLESARLGGRLSYQLLRSTPMPVGLCTLTPTRELQLCHYVLGGPSRRRYARCTAD